MYGVAERQEFDELTQYVATVRERIARTEKEAFSLDGLHHENLTNEERLQSAIKQQVLSLHDELQEVEQQLKTLVHGAERMIVDFKDVIRRAQLEQVQARVDAWHGESYVTRAELRRWIDEARARNP